MVDLTKRRWFKANQPQDTFSRLPWLKAAQSFTDICTRCGQCADHCDANIIIKGDGGFPQIDFSLGECTFCYQCATACPEPLFIAKEAQPWALKASINESCLAQQNVECRSCGDMCEPMAIQFRLAIGKVAQPHIEIDTCNGCGACVAACPTASISVSDSV
ncbi:ferredoxin-type protein NapF [Vibrio sp. JPW-9-11-11]|uniref:ferredoxin-type protein NapF n=1 Tax=Vibrio sp. JPW-9-11-11 TaxID=1416532 RepID=UPI0015945625|nr:ferredoxin-type protein NapF [Vibrio sp. JPW-9-11-11]